MGVRRLASGKFVGQIWALTSPRQARLEDLASNKREEGNLASGKYVWKTWPLAGKLKQLRPTWFVIPMLDFITSL